MFYPGQEFDTFSARELNLIKQKAESTIRGVPPILVSDQYGGKVIQLGQDFLGFWAQVQTNGTLDPASGLAAYDSWQEMSTATSGDLIVTGAHNSDNAGAIYEVNVNLNVPTDTVVWVQPLEGRYYFSFPTCSASAPATQPQWVVETTSGTKNPWVPPGTGFPRLIWYEGPGMTVEAITSAAGAQSGSYLTVYNASSADISWASGLAGISGSPIISPRTDEGEWLTQFPNNECVLQYSTSGTAVSSAAPSCWVMGSPDAFLGAGQARQATGLVPLTNAVASHPRKYLSEAAAWETPFFPTHLPPAVPNGNVASTSANRSWINAGSLPTIFQSLVPGNAYTFYYNIFCSLQQNASQLPAYGMLRLFDVSMNAAVPNSTVVAVTAISLNITAYGTGTITVPYTALTSASSLYLQAMVWTATSAAMSGTFSVNPFAGIDGTAANWQAGLQ